MKVNQGNVVINSETSDIKEVLTNIFSYFNTSRYITELQVAEVMNEQGKFRTSSINMGVLPNSSIGSRKWETIFASNMESNWILNNVLRTISIQFDLNPKKSILIFLISNGFHRTFNNFKLVEDLVEVPGWNYEDIKRKSEENKELNKIIEQIKLSTDNLASEELEDLYNWIELNLSKETMEWFKNEYGEDIVVRSNSSLKRSLFSSLDLTEDIQNEFSKRIDTVRAKSIEYAKPPVAMLCTNYFHIGESTYRRAKNAAILSLVNTYGSELMKYTIEVDE